LRLVDQTIDAAQTMSSVRPVDVLTAMVPDITATGSSDAEDLAHRIADLSAAKASLQTSVSV
jgi:hypothetical protein